MWLGSSSVKLGDLGTVATCRGSVRCDRGTALGRPGGGILLGAVIHVSLMANSHKSPYTSTSTSTVELVPYRDELPMTTPRLDDSPLPALRSPGLMSDADAALPPHLRFRSTVPLLPTPGTISKRHPSYVRRRSTCVD